MMYLDDEIGGHRKYETFLQSGEYVGSIMTEFGGFVD